MRDVKLKLMTDVQCSSGRRRKGKPLWLFKVKNRNIYILKKKELFSSERVVYIIMKLP